jgi:hypothetical protein
VRPSFGCCLRLASAALPPAVPCFLTFDLRLGCLRAADPSSQPLTVGRLPLPAQPSSLRSPLALQASSRGHPSEANCRLLDNPFVRFCFPIALQLAPSPNRSASRSSPSPACTADQASRSAVLSVDWLAPIESDLPASSSAASSACTAERASDSAILPGRLTYVSQPAFGPLLPPPVSLRLW